MKTMERIKTKEYILPFTALCKICDFQMTDRCGGCLQDNLSSFEPKDIPIEKLRIFTMEEYKGLPNGAKGKILAYYVIRIMEVLHGNDPDRT